MFMSREERIESEWKLLYDNIKRENNQDEAINKKDFIELLENMEFHLKHAIKDVKNNDKICDIYKNE